MVHIVYHIWRYEYNDYYVYILTAEPGFFWCLALAKHSRISISLFWQSYCSLQDYKTLRVLKVLTGNCNAGLGPSINDVTFLGCFWTPLVTQRHKCLTPPPPPTRDVIYGRERGCILWECLMIIILTLWGGLIRQWGGPAPPTPLATGLRSIIKI